MKMPSVFPVASHTDNVGPGSTFVAIRGLNFDGHNYINVAIKNGATTIVVEDSKVSLDTTFALLKPLGMNQIHSVSKKINFTCSSRVATESGYIEGSNKKEITIIKVKNTRKYLAQLSAQAAGNPAKKLKLLGVTGTKGKTTSIYTMHYLLKQVGYKVALLSTIKNSILDEDIPATMTTAQPDYLHQFFKLCIEADVEYVLMELAAQATTFHRLETLEFDGLIFTNLDREHAELYPSMQSYFAAKAAIFDYAKQDCVMISNVDDEYGKKLVESHKQVVQLSVKDWKEGQICIEEQVFTYSHLPGKFNAYNLKGVLLLLIKLGIKIDSNIGALPAIPGRLQKVDLPNGAHAYIDYAHTPGSFKSLFSTVRTWTNNLIIVFGAGGSKDHQKRALMGAIAEQFADTLILTDDNPRTEDPKNIIKNILVGITNQNKIIVEHDRQKAIEHAYSISKKDSIILLLGKGPDEYQIIGTKKIPFSEKGILESL
ncbi:MAG: UDP-N-acetylmuramoyl-L-alanyl-D-glutamate--2,6-diaminopimelate ligase [Alteromonas naphthalenivorans]|jgi:UDP-N-acetylmuramoyl-L-alanyl-D-glutamate--2,6-diaminopimelate ligase